MLMNYILKAINNIFFFSFITIHCYRGDIYVYLYIYISTFGLMNFYTVLLRDGVHLVLFYNGTVKIRVGPDTPKHIGPKYSVKNRIFGSPISGTTLIQTSSQREILQYYNT